MLKKYKLLEIDLQEEDYSGEVLDIEVEDDHSYALANGAIVHNCSDAAHGLGGHVCADGGITCAGDLAKAFGAGADFCMLGSLLAGHTEGGGGVYTNSKGVECVSFCGMSSKKAQEAHGTSLKEYRASEGRVLEVPFKGPVAPTIQDLLGGLRSACTYTGSKNLKELPKRTTFIQVNRQIETLYGLGEL